MKSRKVHICTPINIVVIGSSTGGPPALRTVLSGLTNSFPVPIVIVQHMMDGFIESFVETLGDRAPLDVKLAAENMRLERGTVYVAPSNAHLKIKEEMFHLDKGEPENFCKPAVDVTLRAVAENYGAKALVVMLTGMGEDGLKGCRAVDKVGGAIYVQDQETSTVWGMPGAVSKAGLAQKELPLTDIAKEMNQRAWFGRVKRIGD